MQLLTIFQSHSDGWLKFDIQEQVLSFELGLRVLPMRILLATHNVELGLLRAKVLESEGHEVEIGINDQQLLALVESRKYDLLLVCHSLPEDICENVAQRFRTLNPSSQVVGILKQDWDDDTCGTHRFDARVSGVSGPSALVATVRNVGRQSAGTA